MSNQPSIKTVLEVFPDTHSRVKRAANKAGESCKRFASLLLNYAERKYEAGELQFTDPGVVEVEAPKKRRRKSPAK